MAKGSGDWAPGRMEFSQGRIVALENGGYFLCSYLLRSTGTPDRSWSVSIFAGYSLLKMESQGTWWRQWEQHEKCRQFKFGPFSRGAELKNGNWGGEHMKCMVILLWDEHDLFL